MEGIDPGLVALLKENGVDGQNQWNNPFLWLIFWRILERHNGDEGGAAAGATQAKLDCLAQGQQEALAAAHNMNMTNLFHSSELAANASTQRLAAQLAECCCNLKAGQKDIENAILKCCCEMQTAICNQTNTLTTQNTANTQAILNSVDRHADAVVQDELAACKAKLSNSEQTKELLAALNNNSGHRDGG